MMEVLKYIDKVKNESIIYIVGQRKSKSKEKNRNENVRCNRRFYKANV